MGAQVQFRVQKLFIYITMLIILSRESAYNKKYDPSGNPSRSHAGMSFLYMQRYNIEHAKISNYRQRTCDLPATAGNTTAVT